MVLKIELMKLVERVLFYNCTGVLGVVALVKVCGVRARSGFGLAVARQATGDRDSPLVEHLEESPVSLSRIDLDMDSKGSSPGLRASVPQRGMACPL